LIYTALLNAVENDLGEIVVETNQGILSRKEAAVFLGVCLSTLDRLDIPRTKIRDRVFYKREILNKWIDEHTEKKDGKKK
jgi:hypothetical protein